MRQGGGKIQGGGQGPWTMDQRWELATRPACRFAVLHRLGRPYQGL